MRSGRSCSTRSSSRPGEPDAREGTVPERRDGYRRAQPQGPTGGARPQGPGTTKLRAPEILRSTARSVYRVGMNEPGLRERKKQATRDALRLAAARLAALRGWDQVKVED